MSQSLTFSRAAQRLPVLGRFGDADGRTDEQAGLFEELADDGLLLGLVAVDCAAGQVEIAALAAVDAVMGATGGNGAQIPTDRRRTLLAPLTEALERLVYCSRACIDTTSLQAISELLGEARRAVFVDEVNEFNGPLYFIPKSHKKGAIEAKHDLTTTSYPLWVIDNDVIAKLVKQGGIVAPKGGPGSAIFFHGTLVHGSPPNMSPWDRQIIYVTYNSVQNAITRYKRPAYIAHRDFTPLDAWEDDCVTRAARQKVAAE